MNKLTTVAVYGSLRQGMGNHRLLEGSKFLGTDVMNNMAMVSFGAYPACDFCDSDDGVVVEVYKVGDETALRLDRLEGCDPDAPEGSSNYYSRAYKELDSGDWAWIYYINGVLEEGHTRVDSGDWVKFKDENAFVYRYG